MTVYTAGGDFGGAASDALATSDGALRRIIWIGHRRIDCQAHPNPQDVWPVRVRAGTFGDATPHRDLWLSPDHAVFIDKNLIPVRYLTNGATIAPEHVENVTYWHVELDRQAVIFADGAPCESYLDTGNRSAFNDGVPAVMQCACA